MWKFSFNETNWSSLELYIQTKNFSKAFTTSVVFVKMELVADPHVGMSNLLFSFLWDSLFLDIGQ